MRTMAQNVAGMILATTSVIFLPAIAIAGTDWPAIDRGSNAAYEDFSGTHATTTPKTVEGMQGSVGMKGEAGMAGAKTEMPDINQAFEDYSGTHATPAAVKAGMKGPSGIEGESGRAGRADSGWSPFNLPCDVSD
jgi:hypothetical protein